MKTGLSGRGASGQAIVLVALSMILVLGGVILAIDGGQLFEARRHLQNAADLAANAGGVAMTLNQDWQIAAQRSVDSNAPGVQASFVASSVSDPRYPQAIQIKVHVETRKQTFFAGLLGLSSLPVSADAVELILPRRLVASAKGTVTAASNSCNNGASLHNGGFTLPYLVSWNDINATAADGAIDTSIHVSVAQYSTHVTVSKDQTESNPLPSYGLPILSDFDPGGAEAVKAGGDYHLITGDFAPNFNNAGTPPLKGIYRIIGGAFNPKGSPIVDPAGVTIVADGSITISANNITMNAYVGGLLMVSELTTSCSGNAIHLSTKNATLVGGLFAPNGGIDLSLSTTTVDGWVWGQTVSVSASSATFVADNKVTTPIANPSCLLWV